MAQAKNSFEGFPELRVEDGVDDGVEAGVDITKEGGDVEGNIARGGIEVVLDAEGVQDVAGEEWGPADKKSGWGKGS